MDRKTMNALKRLRDMGATRVRIGEVEVEFGAAPPPIQSLETQARSLVEETLAELRESLMDEREVESVERKAQKQRKLENLKYSHG